MHDFSSRPHPLSWRAVAVRFALIFVPLLVASGVVVGGLYWSRHQSAQRLVERNEQESLQPLSEIIAADFKSVVSDLMILAQSRALEAVLLNPDDPRRQALADEYQRFLQHKQIYDQVRYLDVAGNERVRINYRNGWAEAVPDDRLQNKSDRYYVKAASELSAGDVFVSPLDLNVEEGQIERPFKPTIRFATPVFDPQKQRGGIVVLNYLGAKLLEKLHLQSARSTGKAQLINAKGYWLAGPTPADEWGEMFPEQVDRSFAHRSPEEWERMQHAESGQFRTATGLYTYRTVYPLRSLVGGPDQGRVPASLQADYQWKLMSYISASQLRSASDEFWAAWWYTWIGLGCVLGVVSWLFARLSVRHERARQQLLHRERLAAIGEAMAALAHESRNALQRSQSGLEMLKKRLAGSTENTELVNEVQEAQVYLTDLYEAVRGYAAPVHLHREPTDLRALLRATWNQLTHQRRQKAALLDEGVAGGPSMHDPASPNASTPAAAIDTHCDVDPRAIGQVLRNVLENALAAADPARIEVHWHEARLDGRPALRLAVRDNGPGIRPADRERIFEPFFTTKARGTGLGLAISRRIVAAHGGEIELAGGAGPGAEFWITLPRRGS